MPNPEQHKELVFLLVTKGRGCVVRFAPIDVPDISPERLAAALSRMYEQPHYTRLEPHGPSSDHGDDEETHKLPKER